MTEGVQRKTVGRVMGDKEVGKDEARALAQEILKLDDVILAVIITDATGSNLAYLSKGSPAAKPPPTKKEDERIGVVEFLRLSMAPRPGQDSGEVEYLAYVYQRFKIVIAALKKPKLVVGLKLARSSNAEYVFNTVLRKCM